MPQQSPAIELLRSAYPSSFATQPDVTVRDYFYRLMFEPSSFTGDVKQGQTARRQVLSDLKQLAQQAIPGAAPPSDKEFVIWARKQALGMAPERPAEIKERQAFSRKAFDYEQKFGELAHPILFTEEFAKNLFGKPAASLVSVASIVPGVSRETSQAVADAISPRLEFGRHVTEKYGTVAGLAYTFGEALAGFGPVASAARLGAGLTAATRIPGIAQAAGAIARNETLFNTLFFGSYSAGEYNRSMLEQGREPTAGGFAANLAAGGALGYMFPRAKKVFIEAKDAKPWVNTILAPMLGKRVADIQKMSTPELRALLIDKGFKSRKDILNALQSVRFAKTYKGSIARQLLKQSTKAGVLGAVVGGVSQASQGMPIDMPSLIQNAVFMMGFHAHGVLGAIGKPLGKAKPGKVEDGVLRLGVPGHRQKLIDAFRPFYEEPDIAPERGIAEFSKRLRETYGVEKIEVEKGEFKSLADFFEMVDPRNLPESVKDAIGKIGRARAEGDNLLVSKEQARLDSYFAQLARGRGESPTEVPFAELEAVDVPTVKKAQTMYMWMHELIGNNIGREAQNAFRRGLGTDMALSGRAGAEPEVARILERFPAAEAVERFFDATVRNLEVSPELWEAAKLFTVPKGLLEAPARYPALGAPPERPALPPGRPTEGRGYVWPMPAGRPGFEVTPEGVARPRGAREPAPVEERPAEPSRLAEMFPVPESVKDLRDAGLVKEGAKVAEKDGVIVAEKGRGVIGVDPKTGKPTEGMLYDVFQLKKPIGAEITPEITSGSTVSEAKIRKSGFPIPGEKKPSAKPKPEVVKPIREARKIKGLSREDAERVYDTAKRIGPTKFDAEQALSKETMQSVLDTEAILVKNGFLGKKTILSQATKETTFEEKHDAVKRIWQAGGRAIWASTREKGQVVSFGNRVGEIVDFNPKTGEYRILEFGSTSADPKQWIVNQKWHHIDRFLDADVLKGNRQKIIRSLNKAGFSATQVNRVLNNIRGKTNFIFSTPVDPDFIADMFGVGKERAAEAFRKNPDLADRISETGRMLHTWRSKRDPLLTHLGRFLFYGDPEKLVTPKQWNWINKAVEFNRTNPFMNDGRSGTINAADFVQTVLGRRNYHPELAKEGNQPFEPMTREEARKVLQDYARISEAIRDRNWPLAMKVLLPVAMKKYSPRVEREWDALYMYEGEINGIRAKKDRYVHEWNAALGKGDEINPATRTAKFKDYSNRKYGYIWKLSREHGWMPEGKENRWENGRTLAQEFHGLTTGIIPWGEPFLHPKVVEAARAWANPLKPKGRYVMSFRDEAWHFVNNGLRRFEYPLLRGRMYADAEHFRNVYTHWKMQSEKTTPENSDAMRTRFQKEANDILTNEKRKTETINAIMESKKLGKVVDVKGRNIYYPFFDPKLSEKLLEAEAMIEEGRLPSGALGKLMHAQHRKATVEYHVAVGEFDPVRDINTYVESVTSHLWRAAVRYHTWRGTKNIRRDIAENPQYAQLFQRHIEITEKLRSDLLDRQDGPIHRVSQNLGLIASMVMLAHPKTVFRNIVGGHALTAIHSGLRDFAEGWTFRKTPAGKRIAERAGFEAGALFSEAESMTVDPKRFRVIMARRPNAATEHQVDRIVRLLNSATLTRAIPFVTEFFPGLQDLTKGLAFAGSEVGLRETAYLSGFKTGVRRVIESPKQRDKIRVIYGNSPKEMLARIEKKYAELEITPDDVLHKIKKNPVTYKGAKKFTLKIEGSETNAEQRARAYRTGIQEGAKTVMMTQFIYSNLNVPAVMKHPLGRVLLVFRKYTWNRFNFASTIIKEAMPQRGGGPEEFGRLMRFAIALSAAKALGAVIGFNLYRFVEDDIVSTLGSIGDWFSADPDRRRQATFGKPVWQFLSGAVFSRWMDVLINSDMPVWEKVLTASHLPYSRAAADAYREFLKISERRKNVYEALMNFHFGLYRYNYDFKARRRRAARRSR